MPPTKRAALSGISKMLRDAFRRSGQTMYAVARDTGIPEPTVGRVLKGQVDPGAATAEKLLAHFGFTIVPPQRKGRA